MTMNKNKIITFLFVLVIFYFPIHATCSCILAHAKLDSSKIVDWEKLYPYSSKNNKTSTNVFMVFEKINEKIKSKIATIEEKFKNYIPYKIKLTEFQMMISKLLGTRLFIEKNGLIVLNNDYLDFYATSNSTIFAQKSTIDLFHYCKYLNSDFIFVVYPCKKSKFDNQLPKGLKDNENTAGDEFLSYLRKNKVKSLDLREVAKNDYRLQYEMFFRTDHHWKPTTGLWASKVISSHLNNEFGYKINTSILDKYNYKITTLHNFFLGSQGKKITLTYTKPDDFDIVEPKFETNFQRFCPDWGDASGSFKDLIFDYSRVKENDIYKSNPYYFYLHRDEAYLRLINNSPSVYKKVCLVKDSFSVVVAPFLALGIKDLIIIDTRHFTGSIKTFLQKEKFDLVIVAYTVTSLIGENKFFDFD